LDYFCGEKLLPDLFLLFYRHGSSRDSIPYLIPGPPGSQGRVPDIGQADLPAAFVEVDPFEPWSLLTESLRLLNWTNFEGGIHR
jgi:hypothetical protein